jgi:hypothetical protein
MKQKIKAPESELECFHWLEKNGLLNKEFDQYFSPHKAEHRHYSLRYAAFKKGWPQPPGGKLFD